MEFAQTARSKMGIDPFTADTLMSMIRYIADDRRIARHLGIPEVRVRQARTRLPGFHRMSSRNLRRDRLVAEVRKQVMEASA